MGSIAKYISLLFVCLATSAALLSPKSRTNLNALINPESRMVLATLPFKSENSYYKIVKLRTGRIISIEIYKTNPGSLNGELHAVFEMPDTQDVFYDFKSSLSNLFEANIDSDPANEIIVPVMDHNLVARLGVIKYEPANENFSYHTN